MASAAVFKFQNDKEGLRKLEEYLRDHSFLSGYYPTQQDFNVVQDLGLGKGLGVHTTRWFNNISSYTSGIVKPTVEKLTPIVHIGLSTKPASAAPPAKAAPAADDDDDIDLFGSDEEEDAQAAAIREQRLKDYASKKSNKPALIAKSSIVLDVKPWDDETDMAEMEKTVRTIVMDGLVWGASKLVPVGYGIHKLQIMCVVEDDKVSVDLLSETIQEFEDFVQSVDIAAFNKI